MIKDIHDRLYVGVSDDPRQRLNDHNHKQGAAFTFQGKFKIAFLEEHTSLKDARSREVQIKKWRRDKKELLIGLYERGISTYNN